MPTTQTTACTPFYNNMKTSIFYLSKNHGFTPSPPYDLTLTPKRPNKKESPLTTNGSHTYPAIRNLKPAKSPYM